LVPICSGERLKYPRTNFSCGTSNLKLLTANEWGGVAFAMALMVCPKKVRFFQKFTNVRLRNEEKYRQMNVKLRIVLLFPIMTITVE